MAGFCCVDELLTLIAIIKLWEKGLMMQGALLWSALYANKQRRTFAG